MQIYLDTCVIQDLKKTSFEPLLEAILKDSPKNIYCFSEAHIQDLVRDKTDEKFADMDFIEKIVHDNCYFYNKKICFEYLTPKQYYDLYDWDFSTEVFGGEDEFSLVMRTMFQMIPLRISDFILPHELPADFPGELVKAYTSSSNFYEFMQAFLDRTNVLIAEQKEFKKLIQYLHKNMLAEKVYSAMGIEGFDGEKVTDMERFRDTYTAYFMNGKEEQYRYDLFMQMHSGLEMLGIVKGRPKKQQMMNLINDGRHAFFGAFCDILVTKDVDMMNKAKFMYEFWNVKTKVLTIEQFSNYLQNGQLVSETVFDMLDELEGVDELVTLREELDDNISFVVKQLKHTYLGVFDIIAKLCSDGKMYNYFSQQTKNLSTGTLTKEIEYVVNKLVEAFGPDMNGKSLFDSNEIGPENWSGRDWVLNKVALQLRCEGKLVLFFFQCVPVEV